MSDVSENTTTRMAAEVRNTEKLNQQRFFMDRLVEKLRDHAQAYPHNMVTEMPRHDIIFTSGIAGVLLEMFQREPDVLASFLPADFVVVRKSFTETIIKTMADAIPITSPIEGRLGPVNGVMMAEMIVNDGANRLYGLSEMARRQHEEAERQKWRTFPASFREGDDSK